MDIFSAMRQRKSVRAYLDEPVSRADIDEIINYAGRAPSAINLQPWEYVITYGDEKDRLIRRLKRTHAERSVTCGPGTSNPLPDKYIKRSRDALNLMKPKIAETGIEFNRFIEEGSCSFYGAPIAIIVTIEKSFPKIRYLDIGLSVSYLLLAAQAKNMATCPIGLIEAYGDEISEVLSIPEERKVLLGIALGYADEGNSVNNYKTDRDVTPSILTWFE